MGSANLGLGLVISVHLQQYIHQIFIFSLPNMFFMLLQYSFEKPINQSPDANLWTAFHTATKPLYSGAPTHPQELSWNQSHTWFSGTPWPCQLYHLPPNGLRFPTISPKLPIHNFNNPNRPFKVTVLKETRHQSASIRVITSLAFSISLFYPFPFRTIALLRLSLIFSFQLSLSFFSFQKPYELGTRNTLGAAAGTAEVVASEVVAAVGFTARAHRK